MENQKEVKKHPPYKEAIEKILCKFENDGYGCIITDDEFEEYLSIEKKELKTIEDFQRYNIELLQRYTAIEKLLCDHDICLIRSKENNGFEILHPKDQVTKGYDKHITKLRRELNKVQQVLVNVNHQVLSLEEEKDRQLKIIKNGFIKNAMNRRKFELPLADKIGLEFKSKE